MTIIIAFILTSIIFYVIYLHTKNEKLMLENESIMKRHTTPKFYSITGKNGRTIQYTVQSLVKLATKGLENDNLVKDNKDLSDKIESLELDLNDISKELYGALNNLDVSLDVIETLKKTNTYDQGFEDGLIIGLGEDA